MASKSNTQESVSSDSIDNGINGDAGDVEVDVIDWNLYHRITFRLDASSIPFNYKNVKACYFSDDLRIKAVDSYFGGTTDRG
jgi:hypothetical protein